jgi:hypothetical protein
VNKLEKEYKAIEDPSLLKDY